MAQQPSAVAHGKRRYEEADLESHTRQFLIQDHKNDDIAITWYSTVRSSSNLPPFPFQVYVLSSAGPVAEDTGFPREFAAFIDEIRGADARCNYHLQVYKRSFPNILACVAHQREEIRYRHRQSLVPRMVASWTTRDEEAYKGHILVIDAEDWRDEGVVFVSFDPVEYENGNQFDAWNLGYWGDCDLVHATRVRDYDSIKRRLKALWSDAGHTWAEMDLQRRNDGGVSPVLYPAIDPAAHEDAEHEEIHEIDGTELPGPEVPVHPDDYYGLGSPKIINIFDPNNLFLRESELRDYRCEMYSDNFGLPVTSVWKTKFSRTRPRFSFTLYLAFDFFDKVQINPKALFRCLDKGLIANQAWTLDIVANMPSLDAAFQYHARASSQRTPERVEHRQECMHLILDRIAGSKLPEEILEYIEDLLVPPPIHSYSSRPCRPFEHMFLYLDKGRQYNGPIIVYSERDETWFEPLDSLSSVADDEPNDPIPVRAPDSESVLRVVYQRFWHRVSDELHVLWSLCNPEYADPKESGVPFATLALETPEACVWRSNFGIQCINGRLDVVVVFYMKEEIIIPCHNGILTHDLWEECVDVLDMETGKVLELEIDESVYSGPSIICLDSWDQSRVLGFGPGPDDPLDPRLNFMVVQPNTWRKLNLAPSGSWWDRHVHNGVFKNGKEYAFRLRSGFLIPRWTYGQNGERIGPYNLPPICVDVDEELYTFQFRVESAGAPHGSFNQ